MTFADVVNVGVRLGYDGPKAEKAAAHFMEQALGVPADQQDRSVTASNEAP